MLYEGGSWDSTRTVSTPVAHANDAAQVFGFVKEYSRAHEVKFERLGELIMSGDGPWLVAQVIRMTSTDPTYPNGVDRISTFTIVDESGTLKVARDIFVGFEVK